MATTVKTVQGPCYLSVEVSEKLIELSVCMTYEMMWMIGKYCESVILCLGVFDAFG